MKLLLIELWNLQSRKKSFTLLETLASLIILSIVVSGASELLKDNVSYQTYKDLQIIENSFYKDGKVIDTKNIKFVKL